MLPRIGSSFSKKTLDAVEVSARWIARDGATYALAYLPLGPWIKTQMDNEQIPSQIRKELYEFYTGPPPKDIAMPPAKRPVWLDQASSVTESKRGPLLYAIGRGANVDEAQAKSQRALIALLERYVENLSAECSSGAQRALEPLLAEAWPKSESEQAGVYLVLQLDARKLEQLEGACLRMSF